MSFRFWNKRVLEAPTTDDALVVARALRLEGNREATQEFPRSLVVQVQEGLSPTRYAVHPLRPR